MNTQNRMIAVWVFVGVLTVISVGMFTIKHELPHIHFPLIVPIVLVLCIAGMIVSCSRKW